MGLVLKANLKIMLSMARVSINGLMGASSAENGKTIKCMDTAYSLGVTADDLTVSTRTIRSMGMVFSSGQMAVNTMDNGKMANNMELVSGKLMNTMQLKANGTKDKE
jgi:hypothetical protein